MQKSLFDREASEAAKDAGMQVAAEHRGSELELARAIAVELCRRDGETDADQVGQLMFERHGIKSLGPAAGSIFKSGFYFTGRRRKSTRKKNHAREIKIWKLK